MSEKQVAIKISVLALILVMVTTSFAFVSDGEENEATEYIEINGSDDHYPSVVTWENNVLTLPENCPDLKYIRIQKITDDATIVIKGEHNISNNDSLPAVQIYSNTYNITITGGGTLNIALKNNSMMGMFFGNNKLANADITTKLENVTVNIAYENLASITEDQPSTVGIAMDSMSIELINSQFTVKDCKFGIATMNDGDIIIDKSSYFEYSYSSDAFEMGPKIIFNISGDGKIYSENPPVSEEELIYEDPGNIWESGKYNDIHTSGFADVLVQFGEKHPAGGNGSNSFDFYLVLFIVVALVLIFIGSQYAKKH